MLLKFSKKKEEEGIATPDETKFIFRCLDFPTKIWAKMSYFNKFIILNTTPGQSFMKLIVKEDIVIDED